MKPTITASIVTYNGQEDIEPCLRSLLNQTEKLDEIIIVDNASRDGTVRTIEEIAPEVKVIRSEKNLGFGGGHNIAIAQAKTDWVLLVNQDLILEPDAIEKMLIAANHPDIGAVGPLLLREKTDEPVVDTMGLVKFPHYKVIDRHAGKKAGLLRPKSEIVWGISGACVLYRKAALEEVAYPRPDRSYPEYFDEAFFMYKEDVDMANRLNKAHWRSWFEAKSVGYHRRSGRPPQMFLETKKIRNARSSYISSHSYRNHLYFLIKHVSLFALPLVALYELGKLGYLTLFERETLKALPEVRSHFFTMLKRRYVTKT